MAEGTRFKMLDESVKIVQSSQLQLQKEVEAEWKSFATALIKRFHPKQLEALEGRLAKLQQLSMVADYHKRFEAITNETIYLPPLFLVHCFISGLHSNIKTAILVYKPVELDEQRLALEKESYRHKLSKAPGLLPNPRIAPSTPSSSNSCNTITTMNNTALSVTGKTPIRRISPAEAQKRRAQGLCYYCDEKYTWSHKCKNLPQLLLMTEEGDLIEEPPTTIVNISTLMEPHQIEEVLAPSAISYNAMVGGVSPNTLRFTGQIQGKLVQVLLDGGNTHNFIQSRVAKFLGLPIEVVPNFFVLVGNGDRLPCVKAL
ncbi:hypothetical protein H6P81_005844 [Aristolochia fimbriata]|uniref:Retrotransposon gag domain-containing protein n=1 Tax=Aristolochia fimbriata TaxID=158543 RepID=A0AAV7EVL5_ARIFI|nr:hypothetical protein H6P81_005844 [Aristolochia fimbriata]